MSRSVKKYSCFKVETSCKYGQKKANKKIRHYDYPISNGGFYKKIFDSWDVCDFKIVDFSERDVSTMRK